MANNDSRKITSRRRNSATSAPYDRRQSLLSSLREKVRDALTPSWLNHFMSNLQPPISEVEIEEDMQNEDAMPNENQIEVEHDGMYATFNSHLVNDATALAESCLAVSQSIESVPISNQPMWPLSSAGPITGIDLTSVASQPVTAEGQPSRSTTSEPISDSQSLSTSSQQSQPMQAGQPVRTDKFSAWSANPRGFESVKNRSSCATSDQSSGTRRSINQPPTLWQHYPAAGGYVTMETQSSSSQNPPMVPAALQPVPRVHTKLDSSIFPPTPPPSVNSMNQMSNPSSVKVTKTSNASHRQPVKDTVTPNRPSANQSWSNTSSQSNSSNVSNVGWSPFYNGKTTYGGAAAYTKKRRLSDYELVVPTPLKVQRPTVSAKIVADELEQISSTAKRIFEVLNKSSKDAAGNRQLVDTSIGVNDRLMLSTSMNYRSSSASRLVGGRDRINTSRYTGSAESSGDLHIPTSRRSVFNSSVRDGSTPTFTFSAPIVLRPPESISLPPCTKSLAFVSPLMVDAGYSVAPPTTSVTSAAMSVASSVRDTTSVASSAHESMSVEQINDTGLVTKGSLSDKFKPKPGEWDCSVCLVRNKPDLTKCALCETPKPGDTVTNGPVVSTNSIEDKGSLSEKFKAKAGEWDCSTCFVRNEADAVKCVACETPKPAANTNGSVNHIYYAEIKDASFTDMFKAKPGEWDCSVCLVRNKTDAVKCVACETPKPGVNDTGSNSSAAATTTTTDCIGSSLLFSAPTFDFSSQKFGGL